MKRLIPLVLALILGLSLLSGCGNPGADTTLIPSDPPDETASLPPADGTEEPTLSLPTEEPTAEPTPGPTGAPATSKAGTRAVNSAAAFVTGADVSSGATEWEG